MANFAQPIKVTVTDPHTGAVLAEKIVSNDYVLITAGNRYVKSLQTMGQTHMIAVAVEKHPPTAAPTASALRGKEGG